LCYSSLVVLTAGQTKLGLSKAWYGNYNNEVKEIGGASGKTLTENNYSFSISKSGSGAKLIANSTNEIFTSNVVYYTYWFVGNYYCTSKESYIRLELNTSSSYSATSVYIFYVFQLNSNDITSVPYNETPADHLTHKLYTAEFNNGSINWKDSYLLLYGYQYRTYTPSISGTFYITTWAFI